MALGRISGPLLRDNLYRDGVDIAFETDLLYIDVVRGRIGIKASTAAGNLTHELTVTGTTRTTDLIVDTQAEIASFTISGNIIASSNGTISLEPSGANPVVYQAKLVLDDLQISTNTIEVTTANTDLVFQTQGSGQVNINSGVTVNGNLHATGNITADGDITFGEGAQTPGVDDTVTFIAEIASDIIPDATDTWDLGSDPTTSGKAWRTAYVSTLETTNINSSTLVVDGINLILPQGNIYYVAKNGNDTNAGEHEHNPFLTVKHALGQATVGDTVYIYPGEYLEEFPLTVPQGVTVKGAGLRAVNIKPTIGTNDLDAFILNGETTVEDLTVSDFFYNSANNTGYGFRFSADFTVTTRSPYIRNITVITRGSVTSGSDPYGFDQNDAGKGALLDGSVADISSREAAMLFHSCTFFTPNQETITATNGVRIEWLNSFTYFADKGLYAYSSADGFAGAGLTRLRIDNQVGTWTIGDTFSYYDTDGTTVLASGTIDGIDGDYVNLTGRALGFETITDRIPTTVYAQGNAKLSTAEKKFGTASLALDGTGDYASVPTQPDFAFPSTISRLAKTITVNGNAVVSATQSKFGGSSIAFDGTGDYLSLATDTDYGFGTGDFTIEGWFYKTAALSQILVDTRTTSTQNSIMVQSNGGGNLRLFVNGVFVLTSSNNHTLNTWNHLAISRASGVTRFFINGVVSTNTYVDATDYGTTKPLVLGASFVGLTSFSGYIDDFRVSNTARYTTTFTPSTTAFTADSASKLLIHGDSTIVDDNGGGTVTDFTLEAWIYPTVTTYHSIFDFRSVSTEAAIYLGINLSDQVYLYVNGVVPITTAAISLNVWTHVAVVRYNATTKIYINGTQSGSSWADITNYGTTKPLRIGAWYNALYGFTGYIDDVRISKGVARYTATFTAPTTALTGDLNTVLLLNFNGPNASTVFLDSGITIQDLRTSSGGTATVINFADYSDFGAEIRSIGSANVYGNYGAYGDGPGVIAYLISQNFAYIGAGKLTTNDPNDRIGANEITELNGARIYFTSVDNEGNFTVGDLFTVNQRTGDVTFNGQSFSVTTAAGITFTDGTNTTTVLPTEITTGNIKISGNTIESITGAVNVVAANGTINLQNNTYITGDLDVTGDITLGGNITIGDNSTDTISFVGEIISNLVPGTTALYDLGTDLLRWQNAFLSRVEIDGLVIDSNIISTTLNDDDLIFTANGTGRIYIPTNNVQLDQQLTVNGNTNLKATTVNGNITHVGNVNQTGDYTQTGDTTITGNLTISTFGQFEQIRIDGNEISTTATDTDLLLEADGTGIISIPTNNVQISQNLTVNGTLTAGTVNATTINANAFDTGDIVIENNTITTTVTDSDLELSADGTGIVSIPTNNVEITQDLDVGGNFTVTTGTSYLKGVSVIGNITQTGDINQTGNFTTSGNTEVTGNITGTGYLRLPNIEISSSTVTTRTSGTDLQLQANGTGNVVFEGLKVSDNNIQSTVTNSNITLTPQGTGRVVVNSNQSLIIPVGSSGDRPVGANGMIRYNTTLSRYEGWNGSYWLTLGGVEDADGNTKIIAEATPGANDNTLYFYAGGNLTATIDSTKLFTTKFQTNNIDITDNTISAITADSDINITTAGTGGVRVGNLRIRNNTITNVVSNAITEFVETGTGYVRIAGTNGVVIPAGDNSQQPAIPEIGMIRFNTFYSIVEVFDGISWVNVAGTSSGISSAQATDIAVETVILLG